LARKGQYFRRRHRRRGDAEPANCAAMRKPTPRKKPARPVRRSRRDGRRERNRKQLIVATLELAAQEGSGSLTVTRIARAAGMDPSGFYAHFKSAKECEQAAAAEFDRYIGSLAKPYLGLRAIYEQEVMARALAGLLRAWLAEPRWSTLLLRARYEESAFGELIRGILDGVRKDARAWLWDLAAGAGARGRHLEAIAALAELCVGNYMTGLESLAQGRVADIELVARAIAHANRTIVIGELKRIHKERTPG
jgi:AcrR family transcriptional regulator